MKYLLYFRVDELPKLPNRMLGQHWRTRQTQKARWYGWVLGMVTGRKPRAPLERATLRLTRHSAQRPDPDGLVGSWKYVIDGLVACGVLANDTSEHVTLECAWEKASPRKGFITVEVQES